MRHSTRSHSNWSRRRWWWCCPYCRRINDDGAAGLMIRIRVAAAVATGGCAAAAVVAGVAGVGIAAAAAAAVASYDGCAALSAAPIGDADGCGDDDDDDDAAPSGSWDSSHSFAGPCCSWAPCGNCYCCYCCCCCWCWWWWSDSDWDAPEAAAPYRCPRRWRHWLCWHSLKTQRAAFLRFKMIGTQKRKLHLAGQSARHWLWTRQICGISSQLIRMDCPLMLVVLAVVLKLISLHFRFSGFVWYLGVYFNFCTVSKCIYVVWSFLCGLWIWIAFCFFFCGCGF